MTPDEFLAQPTQHYADWFGKGDTHSDYALVAGEYGKPQEVLECDFMLALIYPDLVVTVGYDGNEYCLE